MIQFLDDIEKHFSEWYPREGCGILAVIKGELQWFPCNNVAEDEDDFIIDSSQYIEVSQRGDIVAVVHSHPDASCEPSQSDIDYCNATGIKYYIFSYPEMELYTLYPETEKKEIYGREYKFGVNDCFEAMRDYLKEQNISLRADQLKKQNTGQKAVRLPSIWLKAERHLSIWQKEAKLLNTWRRVVKHLSTWLKVVKLLNIWLKGVRLVNICPKAGLN